jgi:hypothetical protein
MNGKELNDTRKNLARSIDKLTEEYLIKLSNLAEDTFLAYIKPILQENKLRFFVADGLCYLATDDADSFEVADFIHDNYAIGVLGLSTEEADLIYTLTQIFPEDSGVCIGAHMPPVNYTVPS